MGDTLTRFRKALDHDQFVLFCQAIVAVKTGVNAPPFYEVLVRLRSEEEHLLPPGDFIPALESANLMPDLDRWVVRHLIEWYSEKLLGSPNWRTYKFGINLSSASISQTGFLDFIRQELQSHDVPPKALCFEISEAVAASHLDDATRFIAGARQLGCGSAIDDFGSAMASLTHLKNLAVDFIKIDGNFIINIHLNPLNFVITDAINRICHAKGIRTVAEFVESQDVLEKLRQLGVDYAQGFGIAKPHPLEKLI